MLDDPRRAFDVRRVTSFYESRIGMRVHRRVFEPDGPVRAGAVFVHGLGEHGGRHDRHLKLFAAHGIRCVAMDLPGHGLTEGARGDVGSLSQIDELIRENVSFLRQDLAPETQVGLLGHSMGGFFALSLLSRDPQAFDFSWISSPLIDPAAKVGGVKRAIVMVLASLWPGFQLTSGVTSHACKRDEAAIADTAADELVHRTLCARSAKLLVSMAQALQAEVGMAHRDLILLMTHGSADTICPPEPSRQLFDRLPCQDKQYVLLDDLLHEPFNDIGKEVFYEALDRWMKDSVVPQLDKPCLQSR